MIKKWLIIPQSSVNIVTSVRYSSHFMSFEAFHSKSHEKNHTLLQSPSSSQHSSPVIGFLHGVLGNKRNWRTPAKTFIQQNPQYSAFTADLRGHGDSNHISRHSTSNGEKNSVRSCANDLNHLFQSKDFHNHFPDVSSSSVVDNSRFILCGHSFAGKVVLEYLNHLSHGTEKGTSAITHGKKRKNVAFTTFVLDSIPDIFDEHISEKEQKNQNSVFNVLTIMEKGPKSYPTKQAAIDYLEKEHHLSTFISQWLLMNLYPVMGHDQGNGGGKQVAKEWRFAYDMNGIMEMFNDFRGLNYWDLLENFNQGSESTAGEKGKIVFIRAGKNALWRKGEADVRLTEICQKNPHIHYVTMPHVGHWLHAEDLLGLLKIMSTYLPSSSSSTSMKR
jgi:pimeloyl-ACP methyl ester carboxylesterase